MKIYIIIISLIFGVNLTAKVNINSMLNRLNSTKYPENFQLLNDISTYYFIVDDSLNFCKYGFLALEIAKKFDNKKFEVDALNHIAFIYSYRDKKLQLKFGNEALVLANTIDYQSGIAYSFFNIAYPTRRTELAKKIEFYLKSLNLANKINDNLVLAITNTYLGEIYSRIDNYGEAVKYMITAQKIFDKLKKSDSTLRTRYVYGELLVSLGLTYKKLINYKEAETFYKLYQKNSEEINNFYGIAFALNNLGIIYYLEKDYQKSVKYLMSAKDEFEKNGIDDFSSSIYNNLANIYFELKEYNKVEENYQVALQFARKKNDSILQARVISNIADVRMNQKKFAETISLYEQALKLANNQDNDIMKNCYQGLAYVYDSLKQNSISYKYFKLYTKLKDSIAEMTKSDEIGMLTENYKNERIVAEQKRLSELNEKIELEKQERRNNLEYIGILIFILAFFAYLLFIGKYKLSETKIESIIFVALLFLFQFIQVLLDPYINNITDGDPIYNLLVYALIALILTPLDTFSEKLLRKKTIIEVNKTKEN